MVNKLGILSLDCHLFGLGSNILSHTGGINCGSRHWSLCPSPSLSPADCLRTCDIVAHCPNPSVFYGSFLKCLKFPPLHHHSLLSLTTAPLSMCVSACLSISVTFCKIIFSYYMTEGVGYSFYKVVSRSRFGSRCSFDGYIRGVNVNGGCLSMIDICTTFMLRLLTVTHCAPSVAMRIIRYGHSKSQKI